MVDQTFHATITLPVYQGPGDIQSGALAWYGLRAYNAAYATGSNPCLDLHNDSTGTFVATINILSDGTMDVATATTTIAGGASKIGKLYDQSGNGNDLTQGTNSARPTLVLSVSGITRPGMQGTVANSTALINLAFSGNGQAVPLSMSAVAERTGSFTSNNYIIVSNTPRLDFGSFGSLADRIAIDGDADHIITTAADGAFHAIQGVKNGTSSSLYVDGSLTNPATDLGTGTPNTAIRVFSESFPLDGFICEAGMWAGDKSANNATMNSNQHTWYGF